MAGGRFEPDGATRIGRHGAGADRADRCGTDRQCGCVATDRQLSRKRKYPASATVRVDCAVRVGLCINVLRYDGQWGAHKFCRAPKLLNDTISARTRDTVAFFRHVFSKRCRFGGG